MAKRKGGSSIAVYTEVEVDTSEIFEELSDDELLDEIQRRDLEKSVEARRNQEFPTDLLEEALGALRRGNKDHALLLLERTLYPKFKTFEECEKHFATLQIRREIREERR